MEENKSQFLSKGAESLINQLISNLNITEYAVTVTPATSRGDNYMGVVDKVKIKSKKSIQHWILKCAVQAEEFRKLSSVPVLYAREVYIYEKVLVEFDRFQKEKGIKYPFKSYANYHGSLLDAPNECVVMEDMKELGYQIKDRRETLDYNHALLVMKEYGRFHALSFALRDQKPSLFKEIAKSAQSVLFKGPTECLDKIINVYVDKALGAIDAVNNKSAYEKCLRFKKHAVEVTKRVVESQASSNYSVICHSDCWINNFLFKYSNPAEPNTPSELCIIDWQMSHLGSPVLDLTYFLFTCTDKKFRDKHYNGIITEYYKSFSTFLRKLGSDPEKLFPFPVLKEHLKIFSVFAFYMSVQVLYMILCNADEIPDWTNENYSDQVKHTSKNIQTYYSRVRGVVLDFDKLDYEL